MTAVREYYRNNLLHKWGRTALIAKRLLYEYDSPRGKVYEEEIISIRSGIVYEIGLRTLASSYRDDRKQFERLILGFRFWRIHNC